MLTKPVDNQPTPERKYINIFFDREVIDALDDYRFKHRFESRTEAIRFLIQFALKQKPKPEQSSHA